METASEPGNQANKTYLKQLLNERNHYPEKTTEIDQKLWDIFGRNVAILVLDMCGFSKLTAKHGIIHFLAMIHQMQQGAYPAVEGNGGQVIKQEADNIFAIFPNPTLALEAALDIFRAFEAMNDVLPIDRNIYGSIGIGYGKTLVIGDEDLFGVEMNAACKLGEDLAGKMEILITPDAYAALPTERYACTPDSFTISAMDFPCYRFQNCLYSRIMGEAMGDRQP